MLSLGQVEKEGRVMSHVQVGGVDFCDNLPTPEALTAQTRNLNETNTLTQTHSVPPLQNEDGGGCGLIQKASLSNNGKDMVEEQAKEEYAGRGSEEDDEDDIDEVMKEEEEEEESEESSCLNRCQSPDTQMTDSSYSETGREHMDTHFHTRFRIFFLLFAVNPWPFRGSKTPTQANRYTAE